MVTLQEGGGVLGLGFNQNSLRTSFIQNLISKGVVTSPVFSLFLNDLGFNGTSPTKIESNLCIGAYDLETYSQNPDLGLQTHQVDKSAELWLLNLTSVAFNNQNYAASSVLIDIGFPYLAGPINELSLIIKQIQDLAVCKPQTETMVLTCTCTDTAGLPSFTFTIDSLLYTIDSTAYQNQVDGECEVFLFPSNQTFWVLGQIFLRQYYSVWNLSQPSIGFAGARVQQGGGSGGSGNNFSKGWMIAVAVIVSVLVAGGAIAALYMICKKRSMRSLSVSSRDSMISLDEEKLY